MIAIWAVLIVFVTTATAGGTSTFPDVRFNKKGTMSVVRGRISRSIDITSEIMGCVGRVYDGSNGDLVQRSGWKAKTLSVDTLQKGAMRYAVLVLIASSPNCNIQGYCGAAGDNVSVLLVYLDAKLHEVERWRVDVQSCQGVVDVQEAHHPSATGEDEVFPNWYRRIDMADGKLRVRFTRYRLGKINDPEAREDCELLYDTKRVDEGLRIDVHE